MEKMKRRLKRLPKYHRIYEQLYENPLTSIYHITKNTGIARSTVSRYLQEMYEFSVIVGPAAFVKPVQNYKRSVAFLKYHRPSSAFIWFKGFPKVISRTLSFGGWDLMLMCEAFMDFSQLKGFRGLVHQDVKGVTVLSKVTSLDWGTSMGRMLNALSQPKKKSSLYEEIPHLPWKWEEWSLYHGFRGNVRINVMPVLGKCGLRFEKYQTWFSQLPQYAQIRAAFYPHGLDNYFTFDFLLKSDYHQQLAEVLGMLPSTSIFFSVGEYLFARLHVLTKREKDDLFALMHTIGERGFFTNLECAHVDSSSNRNPSGEVMA